jgi:sRNA-binding regulator protein Hfq
MITATHQKLVFKHMIELPHCECVFCSTQEEQTGRTRLFLVFRERQKVYMRNGIKGNWQEIANLEEHNAVWEGFEQAVLERKVPSFVASADDMSGM